MPRVVRPEILDSLSPGDPAARANRRDLRVYNRLMGNFRWFALQLKRPGLPSGNRIELGAGDGGLGLYLKTHDTFNNGAIHTGVDLIGAPGDWPNAWKWIQGDLLEVDLGGDHPTLLANLILHQFRKEQLEKLGQKIQDSGIRTLFINEPVRRPLHLWQVSLSRLLGMHPVSLHDARVSIRAGFRGSEVAELLQLKQSEWSIQSTETFMGANRVICIRQ